MPVLESWRTLLSSRRTDAESIITTAVQAAADGTTFDVDGLLAALVTKGSALADFEKLVEIELGQRAAVAMIADADALQPEIEAATSRVDKSRLALTKAEAAHREAREKFEAAFTEQRNLTRHDSDLRFRANQRLSSLTSN